LDLSDDEELKEAFNVHAIVSPCVLRDPETDINADDVIQEIDTLMKVSEAELPPVGSLDGVVCRRQGSASNSRSNWLIFSKDYPPSQSVA